MSENKKLVVDPETAKVEFDRFAELMDLDLDEADMDTADRKDFNEQKRIFLRAIQRGHLAIDEKGQPIYTVQRGEHQAGTTIVFKEPTGAALMAMDRKKSSEDVGKIYATMAEITGQHVKFFASLKYPDVKVCTAIVTLFLA